MQSATIVRGSNHTTIRILQLVTEREHRGAQVFASELSTLLAENGHEVFFVGLFVPRENILLAKGAENIDLNGKRNLFDVDLLRRLIKLIKKIKPDIIQANGADTLKYASLAKTFCPGINLVYRNISMVSAWTKKGSMKRRIMGMLFKKVDRVTSVGERSMNDLIETYNYPANKARLIRRGIPQYIFDAEKSRKKITTEFHFPTTDFMLMHIGQFSPEKNHEFMVASFEKVLAHDHHARLLFVGEGPTMPDVKELVQKKNLDKHILFAGHRHNVQELLAGADLFVLGSKIEGVPGVVLEAGMQSIPTVAVTTGGVGEVVMNGKTGVLLDQHDAVAFGNAVVSMMENDAMRKSFGQNAKHFVEENYGLQRCLSQFEDLYMDLLKEKKQRA